MAKADPGADAPYDAFAWFYEKYWAEAYARDVRPILGDLLLPQLEYGARIVDLCCGTGQLACWLRHVGFAVTGVDISPGMLAIAREKQAGVDWVEADARDYVAAPAAGGCISLFDSINHLPTLDDLRRVFSRVACSLEPGAPFFFDANMEEAFVASDGETFAYVRPDHACIAETDWRPAEQCGSARLTMFRLQGEEWRRADSEITEYCYSLSHIVSALGEAGFGEPRTWLADEDLGMPEGLGRVFFLAERLEE